ncbi:MAG TPA: COX15/CtaA family protein [Chthoniobacterales bacterium]|jgi:cytochrome c oxidase assembly protein subunit 15
MNTKALHRFSLLLFLVTFVLIFSGGLVTSKGVGMAVPDWPTTYGYNMFLFPYSKWVGGIFHEHLHRLIASVVGLLTVILCVWFWISEKRSWIKHVGVIAVFAVILQGVLGGQRVVLNRNEIGIFHGCLAQSFLLLTAFLALATSGWWKTVNLAKDPAKYYAPAALFLTVLIFINMAVAATMRHSHSGLSIPDFPAAYGRALPPLDPDSIEKINTERIAKNIPETSAGLIMLQFVHRLIGYFLAIAISWFSFRLFKTGGVLKKWALIGPVLIIFQIALGAYTIWSNKAADVATAHVATGAAIFVLSGLTTIIAYRARYDTSKAGAARKGVEVPANLAEVAG